MKKFAVFDIDGTLIRWQLYHAVVNELAQENLLGDDALQKLHEARMVWKRREHPKAFSQYEAELIKIYETALPNVSTKKFDAAVEKVANEFNAQVYRYTRDLILSLKKQNYVLIAISGSHQELVEKIAKQFDFDLWTGTKYERRGGAFSGKSFIASHNKRELLQEFIAEHNLTAKDSYAVGDSKSDAPMLELVEHPIAFNPDQELFEIAQKNTWPIVIERKNVVYKLEANKEDHGKYVLG